MPTHLSVTGNTEVSKSIYERSGSCSTFYQKPEARALEGHISRFMHEMVGQGYNSAEIAFEIGNMASHIRLNLVLGGALYEQS